jgi:inner membrane protein
VDNICHTLVGSALGQAGLRHRTRYGNAALMIAANLPDLDVLVFLTAMPSLSFRRGWTHGIAAQVLLPIVLTGILLLVRRRGRAGSARPGDPALSAGWLLCLSYVGVCSHVFLDFLNTYGVRLLTPVDWRWLYGDAIFIVDPWLWLVLGLGVWLARRQRRTAPARGALVFAACYIVTMLASARVARDMVAGVWHDTRGVWPRALMVGPAPVTPFTRMVIVDAGDHYESGTFTWRSGGVTFEPTAVPKNDQRPEVDAATRQSADIRAFLVWSRFPFWTITTEEAGTRVTVRDMRFAGGGVRFAASTVVRP